jgi:hypothetical protein
MDKYTPYIETSEELRPYFRECLLESIKSHLTDFYKSQASSSLSYVECFKAVQTSVMSRLQPLITGPQGFNSYVLDKVVIDKLIRRTDSAASVQHFRDVTGTVFAENTDEQITEILEKCLDRCVDMYLFKKITFK